MAWVESDGSNEYILTIAGKEKIIANPDSSYLFYEFKKVTEIKNIGLFNKNNVENMKSMFGYCNSIVSLDLSNFNTSNVKYMNGMFRNWYMCENLDLSNFDISSVTGVGSMFEDSSFISLNLDGWDTSNVIDMSFMFFRCNRLISLGNKGLDICGSVDIQSMFSYTTKLKATLNIRGSFRNVHQTFYKGISDQSSQITLNYAEGKENLVDNFIVSYPDANLVKGVQI